MTKDSSSASETAQNPQSSRRPMRTVVGGIILALVAVGLAAGAAALVSRDNAPAVKDIQWQPPKSFNKSDWQQVKTAAGSLQYKYRDTSCIVAMEQQTGLNSANVTTAAAVVNRSAGTLGNTLRENANSISVTRPEQISFRTDDAKNGNKAATFEASNVVYAQSGRSAKIAAYVKGDRALIAAGVCTIEDYKTYFDKAVRPFINGFTVNIKR